MIKIEQTKARNRAWMEFAKPQDDEEPEDDPVPDLF
jgi:hypothetical protein